MGEYLNEIMPITAIDDWQQRLKRQDAFWHCEVLDRPVACIAFDDPEKARKKTPHRSFEDEASYWLNPEWVAELAVARNESICFMGDALPKVFPNLGPEVFSGYFGCELSYGRRTAWSIPNLEDWSQVHNVRFSEDNFYFRKTLELTDALLEAGRNKFYVGYTDLHPGGDAIAAFRDPLNLNIDMIENPEKVKDLLAYVDDCFEHTFKRFSEYLKKVGQAYTGWLGIVSSKCWHVPSNDFSCMISKEMFDDVFLPGIARECRLAEASIYHLDGPDALRHLDSLLEIPELNAIQWVYGAGNGSAVDWLDVYKKIQDRGKGIQLAIPIEELDTIMEALRPEGTHLTIGGIHTRGEAELALKRVSSWRTGTQVSMT